MYDYILHFASPKANVEVDQQVETQTTISKSLLSLRGFQEME